MIKTNLDNLPIRSMEYKLPSAGIPYGADPTVTIKPYTFATESILIGNMTSHEKMKRVTAKVVEFPANTVQVGQLLIADQYLILAIARALTYGESYRFKVTCPMCEYTSREEVKIPENLPVKVWSADRKYPLETNLPVCKDRVALRYLTVDDDGELDKYARALQAKQNKSLSEVEGDETHMRRMAMHLVSVNGDKPDSILEAENYVSRLFGPDMDAYKQLLIENVCGINYEWVVACNKCQHQYDIRFPIADDFFRRS